MYALSIPKTSALIEAMIDVSELDPSGVTLGNPLLPYNPKLSNMVTFEACRKGIGQLEDKLCYDPDATNEAEADRLVTARNAMGATLYWLVQYGQIENGRWGRMDATAVTRRAATFVLGVSTLLSPESITTSPLPDARIFVTPRTIDEQRDFLLDKAGSAKLLLKIGERVRDPLIESQVKIAKHLLKSA